MHGSAAAGEWRTGTCLIVHRECLVLDKGGPCLAVLLEAGEAARQVGTALCLRSGCFSWVDKLQEQRPDLRSRTVLAALAQHGCSVAGTGATCHVSWVRLQGRATDTAPGNEPYRHLPQHISAPGARGSL